MDFRKLIRRVTSIQAKRIIAESKKPVVIQLFSNACNACHESFPLMQEASGNTNGVEVIAVDGDFATDFVDEHGVEGFPTAIGFRNGQKVAAFEGAAETAGEYTKFFSKCLKPRPVKKAKPKPTSKPRQKPKPKPKPRARKKPRAKKKAKE